MAGDTARLKGQFAHAKKSNKLAVVLAVAAGMAIAAWPFTNKTVYDTEQKMAKLRDGAYDPMEAKNEARNQRLSGPTWGKKN